MMGSKNKKNTRDTDRSHERRRRWLPIVAVAAGASPSLLFAAPWDFGITADLGVIHTNNLFIAPDGAEQSETIFTVAPEFTLENQGDRTQAVIRYRPEAYYYSDFSEADEIYHVADARLETELIRERFFLYLSGVNFQSIETPVGAIPTSNLPISGNRVDSTVLEARPYWLQQLGSVRLRAEAGYRDLDYNESQFQNASEKDAALTLNNFQQQQGLAWGLSYSYRRLEYDESTPFEFQRAAVNLGFWAGSAVRIFGVGGAETGFDNLFEANLDEEFWEAGFEYRPNERLALEVAAGERSYGTSFRGDFSYTLRRGSVSLSYDESPSSRAETVFNVRPLTDTDNLDGFLDRAGNADRFVRKRGEFQTQIDLAKSRLTLRIFSENRDSRSTDLGTPLADETLSGAAARWEWRFGAKTTLEAGFDVARREGEFAADDLSRLRLALDYQFSPRTSLRLEGARAEQDGTAQASYTENQGRLLIQLELL